MAFLSEHVYLDMLALIAGIIGIIVWYLNNNFDYWKKRGVFYLRPELFFGNIKDTVLLRKSLGEQLVSLYHNLGDEKFAGIYENRSPALLIKDPEFIKTIMVKDFTYFLDRGFKTNTKINPLAENLFFVGGPKWRILRTKLSPTFTSGKMKMMFHLVEECSEQLIKFLSKSADNNEIIELRDVLGKFSTDVIGSCAFGLQFNAMLNPDSEFRRRGKEIFEPTFRKFLIRLIMVISPSIADALRLNTLKEDTIEFFLRVVKETVDFRLKNNVTRKDFLQLLIDLQRDGKVQDEHEQNGKIIQDQGNNHSEHKAEDDFELTDELLAAQVFVFFLAGFETSSTVMSVAFCELAMNPEIQTRLRNEIDGVLQECNGKVTYEAIHKMEYLDKVISESMRKYPPLPILNRKSVIPYKIPDTDITLEKGTKIIIPVLALQHDPKYFPDPQKFDPERFSPENKAKRHHYSYLPFGEGPRNCIGMRFGLLQTKMGLFHLLAKYQFSVCEKTLIPLRFDPKTAITSAIHGTLLRISNRT